MKKINVLVVLVFLSFQIQYAQTQAKIDNYRLGNSDVNVVIFSFGMENPITIGTLSKSGEINFDFPKELKNISKEAKESESSKLWYTLFSQCDNGLRMVMEEDNIFSFEAGYLSLSTKDNPYVGVLFTVSDENLIPWIEDTSYMEPILGSYFELIYVASNYDYKGTCITTRPIDDSEMQILYNYNLNLKEGFNFIEYKIENIYKTDPNIMASIPDKVSISSVDGIPNCKWIGKYFYN